MPLNGLIWQRMPPFASAFTSSRIFLYAVFSIIATFTTIANACRNYSNFYSVAIYLSRSGRSLLVLANFGFLSALLSGRVLQHLFFGPLQAREVERLYDQTWMFVTESLLAFTIFRDDFDIPFVIMFGFLLFVKCFHWLMADRVESMDQLPYPGPPLLFHVRMNTLFLILWLVDFLMLLFAIESTISNGVGGMVLFASEYAILMASALNAMARYALSNLEMRRARTRGGVNAPAWENKSMYIFYIELVTDFLKLSVYLTFFVIVLAFYGLPLNMIRDVYLTARSFTSRLRALVRYHNATRDMDRRYPNATEEELTAMSDRTCIICREEMVAPPQNQNPPGQGQAPGNANTNANTGQDGPNVTPKKLPCGHIFHFQCLRSWLERQQSCPTCRRTVLETDQPNRNNGPAAARNARPGPAQPGAAPMGGQPGQQAPNGPAPLGWLGRILGIAVQPPLIPGQFPNGQLPPQFAPPGAAGPQQLPFGWPVPAQQAPQGYLYPYPYQFQHQFPPQQALQPPPVYRGFYGPGGAWHPWGVDAQWLAQGQQAHDQQAQGEQGAVQEMQPQTSQPPQPAANPLPAQMTAPAASAQPASANIQTPTPTTASQPTPLPVPSTSVAATSTNRPSTPRDAAAQAALRRLSPSQPPTLGVEARPSPASVSTASGDVVATDTNGDGASPPTQPPSDTSASSAGPSATSPSTTSPATTPENHHEVPPLIPLYDFSAYQRSMRGLTQPPLSSPPFMRPSQNVAQMQGAPPQNLSGVAQGLRTTSHAQSSSRTPGQEPRYRSAAPRAPLAQLPPTLTDEQLARLDRLTRDAIDERLRILEGVSGAVYRCIEELTRIRSVLPPRDLGDIPTSPAAPTEGARAENPEVAPLSSTNASLADAGPSQDKSLPPQGASASETEARGNPSADDLSRERSPPEALGPNEREQRANALD